MQFKHPYIVLALACGSWVTAAPANECNPVNAVYAILKGPLHTQASSVCLSFLGGDKTVQQTQVRYVLSLMIQIRLTDPQKDPHCHRTRRYSHSHSCSANPDDKYGDHQYQHDYANSDRTATRRRSDGNCHRCEKSTHNLPET